MKWPADAREGAACEEAGTLIAAQVDEAPAPDARQWAAIAAALPARRRERARRRWMVWLGAPALAAGLAVVLLLAAGRRPLTYVATGCGAAAASGVVAAAGDDGGRVTFSDGSSIALDPGARGQIAVPERASSARLVLQRGAAELDVVHRRQTRWTVEAGPFRVDVTGTRFRVAWSPERQRFRLEMRHGEVMVSGGSLSGPTILRSGDVLDVGAVAAGADAWIGAPASRDDQPAPPVIVPPPPPAPRARAAPPPREDRPSPHADDPRGAGGDSMPGRAATDSRPMVDAGAAPGKESSMSTNDLGKTSRAARVAGAASAIGGLGLLATASLAAPPGRPGSPVFIGQDGKLGGPMSGYAWVAAGREATIEAPSPCNDRGCFKQTKGELCTRGALPALRCTPSGTAPYKCNWDTNWGAMVGMHVSADRGPWRAGAPASISIAYRNQGDHGTYRLNAHVAGDPDDKEYCIDGYQSGQVALPGMLRTECWGDGGKPLDSFRDVDHVNLLLLSSEAATSFDYCVTGVAVNGTAARVGDAGNGHVVVGDNGKLGGDMTGYAWVAGGAGTAWSTPATCDRNGCFRNTQGRLCAKGTIAALACTGRGTSQLSCDWATNWGAVIGLNANLAAGAWGAGAPSTVTLAFTGPPVVYRLMAHVAGDPDSENYCLDGYQSGQAIDAQALRTRCWNDSGQVLRDFQKVDRIGLEILAGEAPISFDMCISDIVTR